MVNGTTLKRFTENWGTLTIAIDEGKTKRLTDNRLQYVPMFPSICVPPEQSYVTFRRLMSVHVMMFVVGIARRRGHVGNACLEQ